ncbi:MAG: AarF/UbiB family protein [Dehalococcoidia bacterium]
MNPLQRARRSSRVGRLAAGIYAGYRWRSWRDRALVNEEARRRLSEYHRQSAEKILKTATDLRGLLIKVGQLIGARADLFPDEYIEVLSQLHDAVPPKPYPVIREAIERELRRPIPEVFAELGETPIASASLAQVHRGRLHDGRDVAVKVQYPDIEEIVNVDLQNMRILGQIGTRVLRDFDVMSIVDELTTNIPFELDFINEGRNAEATARNFAGQADIVVPKIYWDYTTRRVLTMEFIEGIKITDMAALDAAGIERQAVAKLLTESYIRQIFTHGFFHADPHPGNLFIQPGPKLVIVDFGLAKQLDPAFLQGFVKLITALLGRDKAGLAAAFRELGFRTKRHDDAVFDALGEALLTRLERNDEFNNDKKLLMEFQGRMMQILRENPVVRVPGEFLYIGRVMGLLGGLEAQLGSEVNIVDVLGAQLPPAASAAQ